MVLEEPQVQPTVFEQIANLRGSSKLVHKVAHFLIESVSRVRDFPTPQSVVSIDNILIDFIGQLFGTAEHANTQQHIAIIPRDSDARQIFSLIYRQSEKKKTIMINIPTRRIDDLHQTDFKVSVSV